MLLDNAQKWKEVSALMVQPTALRSLELINYKGFDHHKISFKQANILVGANNAGKSTALGALRLIAAMIPRARQINPKDIGEVEGHVSRGWAITSAALDASAFSEENIRHDFRSLETRIEVFTTTGVRLVASWADMKSYYDDEPPPNGTFFVFPPDGARIMQPRAAARELVPDIGVVPTLTPLDDQEAFVGPETIRRNRTSRRSSRYFRNALYMLTQDEWIDFTSYVYERTPELTNLLIRLSADSMENAFDLLYEEEGSHREREIGWAGDGIQIWLQALYHLWRNRNAPVVILDEPDVFLHPDLQRRLGRTLFASDGQIVLATHSVEMLAEAEPGSAVWIDRSRRSAERPRGDGSLALLGRRLGSGYELGVGRALRSRTVLFVEGDDAPVLAHLARRLGRMRIASSDEYATVPLGGFSRHSVGGAFAETMIALGTGIRTFVILDGDLRSDEVRRAESLDLSRAGALVHLWKRRELENYLLVPGAVAKVSGVTLAQASDLLGVVLDELKSEALLALQTTRLEERGHKGSNTGGKAPKSILQAAGKEFEDLWSRPDGRVSLVDAKLAIRSLNRRLQQLGMKTLNVHSLAKAMPRGDVDPEVQRVLENLEDLIGAP